MTVADLSESMTAVEFDRWIEFYAAEAEHSERQRKKSERRR